jgi:NTP pyrophosphatase (non-canonical NTP hydrolase)
MNDLIIPGILYVQIGNEIQKIGETVDAPTIELADDSIPHDLVNLESLKTSASFELSTKISEEAILMISGILELAFALCPNNRVRNLHTRHRSEYQMTYQMTINEYQKAAYRTANQSLTDSQQLQNGLMGLNGESGECIDILKKHLFQGHDLDKYHIAKELGDVAWYLAVSAQALGFDLETILQMNVEKLKARYPHGFNAGHSQHRSSGDI